MHFIMNKCICPTCQNRRLMPHINQCITSKMPLEVHILNIKSVRVAV